jgi:carbamoylphosphate synthase small subunit
MNVCPKKKIKMEQKPAVILLEDGTVFHGVGVGKIGTTTGEIAFNTGMTGYQEVFTDPSYCKQILIMTTAHIGNYGVHADEVESDSIKIAGLVTKSFRRCTLVIVAQTHCRTSWLMMVLLESQM